ncbi:leukemia inhibitory factor receptor-like [Corythoichthys intestinalis]|uniref:leukemia inhibitory factor receptor-like n=1 Tax=Corythoichthys intestinalis TaxID=161448 RepID=UPI0025A61EDC|nr:leukemia inhibitory factor receptor-like [Corythoichthys intestinalis]
MITWLLLVSLFCNSEQDGNFKDNGVYRCGPQNMTLSTSDNIILLTWQDDPLCMSVREKLIYELEVLIADELVHYEEVTVEPEQIRATHSWNWSSHLALECASHKLKLRSRSGNHTSQWEQEQTIPAGRNPSKRPEVYPRDKVFQVGSKATFCCVLPMGQAFKNLYISGHDSKNWEFSNISTQVHTLTVDLNRASKTSCTNIICEAVNDKKKVVDNGACAYIGYPPDDRDLTCETRDFQSVDCIWKVGQDTHLGLKSPTTYEFLGRRCAEGYNGRCSHKMRVDYAMLNWTLTAQNQLGRVKLIDRADLFHRVYMLAPQEVKVSAVNSSIVRLDWEWEVKLYETLNIKCQVNISDGETHAVKEHIGDGLNSVAINDLIPNWAYMVRIRCGTTQHFWKWSNWSSSVEFNTMGDVPDALDIWMQEKDNQTIITWKVPLANQSHGDIIDYEISWAQSSERQVKANVLHPKHSFALSLDTMEEYAISVIARNQNGSSSPSTIIIPVLSTESNGVKPTRIQGSNGGFNLSWSASPLASCGYIVDWCPTRGPCQIDWLRVPPSKTHVRIFSKNFREGVRYLLSIHACTQTAPLLLEKKEGYVKEKLIQDGLFKLLKWKPRDMDVEISWDPVAIQEQPAFIHGYILYCWDHNNSVTYISTDDPQATSLTAKNLQVSTYRFTVKANTSVGECGDTSITVTLNSMTDNLIKAVGITLITIFVLLCLIVVLCYRNWECIKLKVYPPIPMPVLKDKWMTTLTKQSSHPIFVEMSHHTEAELTAIPELHCKSEAPVKDYADQENISSPSTHGSHDKPIEKPVTHSTTVPCQSLLLALSSSRGHLNPSFIQTSPDSAGGSDGYKPQEQRLYPEEDTDNPLPCVLTYISLPQLPSE